MDGRRGDEGVQFHMTVHLLSSFDLAGFTCRATLAASVKASFTPRFLIAEHSVGVNKGGEGDWRVTYRDIVKRLSFLLLLVLHCTGSFFA